VIAVFDLDGTLVDSDHALADAFVALGVPREDITFGHLLADECDRLGVSVDDYLAAYDPERAQPYPGIDDLLAQLPVWGVCSNKHPESGAAELARMGWQPTVAAFADRASGPKQLGPVLAALDVSADEVLYVGDTAHDRACAEAVSCRFVLAGWNVRAEPEPGDLVAATPADVLAFLTP